MFLVFRNSKSTSDKPWQLTAEEMRHVKVRRLKIGSEIWVGDGAGSRERCELGKDGLLARSGAILNREEKTIRVFCAIPERPRWEWMIQKLTELGITDIFPVKFQRSETRSVNQERSIRIIEEAAIQSHRYYLPRIMEVLNSKDLNKHLAATESQGNRIVLLSPVAESHNVHSHETEISYIVGPEGGFSDDEMHELSALPRRKISPNILRIETAAVAGCALAGAGYL